jgi:hypothetical protein
MGGTHFVVQVDAIGNNESQRSFALVGEGEASTTGLVAARVAEYLLNSSPSPGALHLEQLLTLEALLAMIENRLVVIENVSESGM